MIPWLQKAAAKHVRVIEQQNRFPDELMVAFVDEAQAEHARTVEAERQRKELVRLYKEQVMQEKEEAKQRRRAAREAHKKASELKKLKSEVNQEFVVKGEPRDNIMIQDMLEVTGNFQKTPMVGVVGGLLGQFILVFSAVQKKWGKDLKGEPTDAESGFLSHRVVQNFLFLYLDSKMRTEKLVLCVGKAYEDFLLSLEKPLQLNEMRVMKESNYQRFRQILSDTALYGDPILRLLREQAKELGLSAKAYDTVYEGLWDLYCKKPQTADLTAKRLEGFLQKVKLVVPPVQAFDEEGNMLPSALDLPLKAIVRIRIPLKRPVGEVPVQENDQTAEDNGTH